MLHYYIQRGFNPEYILNLDLESKLFFKASMDITLEEKSRFFNLEVV